MLNLTWTTGTHNKRKKKKKKSEKKRQKLGWEGGEPSRQADSKVHTIEQQATRQPVARNNQSRKIKVGKRRSV